MTRMRMETPTGASGEGGSFLTELQDTEDVADSPLGWTPTQDRPLRRSDEETGKMDGDASPAIEQLAVLYEDIEKETEEIDFYTSRKVEEDQGSEYDTDIEETPAIKIEYDSSGIGHYLKICEDMKMRPVSHFMRQTKNPSLSLKYQSLGCKKTVAITQALASNTFVECLDLSDNDVGCEGVVSIAHMLTENYFITEINLQDNKVGVRGVEALCRVLSEHSYVKHLDLGGNRLKDNSADLLAEMLKLNYTLTTLILNKNQFSCVGAKAMASALLGNDSLTQLDLSWNRIRAKGGETLGKMLAVNSGLIKLSVAFNGLDSTGTAAFIKAIKVNTQIVNLDIINTRFAGAQCKELTKSLSTNTTLKILKMGNNAIKEGDLEILHGGLAASSLHILGLEDIPMSRTLYERFMAVEKELGIVIHYGNSGGNKRKRPMTASTLVLDEFITTNMGRLVPILLAKDTDKSGCVTVESFKEALKEAGLRLHQSELNRLVDKLNIREDAVPCKEMLSGRVPVLLEKLRYNQPLLSLES